MVSEVSLRSIANVCLFVLDHTKSCERDIG